MGQKSIELSKDSDTTASHMLDPTSILQEKEQENCETFYIECNDIDNEECI